MYISCYPGCSKIICFSIDKDKIWKICYLCFSGPGVLPKFCLEGCHWNVIQCYLANSPLSKLNYRDIQTDRQKPFGDLKGRAGLVNTKIGVLGKGESMESEIEKWKLKLCESESEGSWPKVNGGVQLLFFSAKTFTFLVLIESFISLTPFCNHCGMEWKSSPFSL